MGDCVQQHSNAVTPESVTLVTNMDMHDVAAAAAPSALSDAQRTALWAVVLTSSTLSTLGSLCIILIAVRKLNRFFHRLMFGLSVGHILFSLTFVCQAFFQPHPVDFAREVNGASMMTEEADDKLSSPQFAFGNATTCSALGFLMRFPLTIAMYNCYLSIYFNHSTRRGWNSDTFPKIYEAIAHILAFVLPMGFGTAGVLTDAFNPLPVIPMCDTGPWPPGCDDPEYGMECIRGQTALIQDWLYLSFMLVASAIGLWNTISVYIFVRRQIKVSRRHSFETQYHSRSNRLQSSESDYNSQIFQIGPRASPASAQLSGDTFSGSISGNRNVTARKAHSRVLQKVACQSVMYTVAYFNGLFWEIASRIVLDSINVQGQDTERRYYSFALLAFLFYPLLGFWNSVIYTLPRYMSWRRLYPEKSSKWIIQQVLQGTEPFERFRRRTRARVETGSQRRNCNSDDSASLSIPMSRSPFDRTNRFQISETLESRYPQNRSLTPYSNALSPTLEGKPKLTSRNVDAFDIPLPRSIHISSSTPDSGNEVEEDKPNHPINQQRCHESNNDNSCQQGSFQDTINGKVNIVNDDDRSLERRMRLSSVPGIGQPPHEGRSGSDRENASMDSVSGNMATEEDVFSVASSLSSETLAGGSEQDHEEDKLNREEEIIELPKCVEQKRNEILDGDALSYSSGMNHNT